jgi:hypothetical protein
MLRRRLGIALAGSLLLAACIPTYAGDGSGYSRWPKVRLAGFSVGAGYSHFSGGYPFFGFPYFGSPYYDPAYSAFWYDPFLYSVPPAYFYQDNLGKVKLEAADRNASVYLDGGFAGTVDKLKDMRVEPGVHDVRITDGNRSYQQRIYVLSGKTLTLTPDLTVSSANP